MPEFVRDEERSPKGDHNRRLALGIDPDIFAQQAGVSTEELRDYEMTGPDKRFSLDVAHQVGLTLERYESGSNRTAPSLDDETQQGNSSQPAVVRSAGPEAMRDAPARWEKADESIDESFPASDPPANNRFD